MVPKRKVPPITSKKQAVQVLRQAKAFIASGKRYLPEERARMARIVLDYIRQATDPQARAFLERYRLDLLRKAFQKSGWKERHEWAFPDQNLTVRGLKLLNRGFYEEGFQTLRRAHNPDEFYTQLETRENDIISDLRKATQGHPQGYRLPFELLLRWYEQVALDFAKKSTAVEAEAPRAFRATIDLAIRCVKKAQEYAVKLNRDKRVHSLRNLLQKFETERKKGTENGE